MGRRRVGRRAPAKPLIAVAAGVLIVVLLLTFRVSTREQYLDLRLPHPILLIHGLGGTAQRWDDAGTLDYLRQLGLEYGGRLRGLGSRVAPVDRPASGRGGDFYTLEISDAYGSLELWSREIGFAVEVVREATRASKVILVGFSAGGVASRLYLTEHARRHHTARLVTIAAPHLGSELALVSRLKAEGNATVRGALEPLETVTGINLDSSLIMQLVPEDLNPYLSELNRRTHPSVEYGCIIATGGELPDSWSEVQREIGLILRGSIESTIISSLTNRLSSLSSWLRDRIAEGGGDGVVLIESQNLANVEFFRGRPELAPEIVMSPSPHTSVLRDHAAILESLTGEPSFVDFRKIAGACSVQKSFYVDFRDNLAGLCQVETRTTDGDSTPVSRPVVVESRRGTVGRVAVGPLDPQVRAVDVLLRCAGRQPHGAHVRLAADDHLETAGTAAPDQTVNWLAEPIVPDRGSACSVFIGFRRLLERDLGGARPDDLVADNGGDLLDNPLPFARPAPLAGGVKELALDGLLIEEVAAPQIDDLEAQVRVLERRQIQHLREVLRVQEP